MDSRVRHLPKPLQDIHITNMMFLVLESKEALPLRYKVSLIELQTLEKAIVRQPIPAIGRLKRKGRQKLTYTALTEAKYDGDTAPNKLYNDHEPKGIHHHLTEDNLLSPLLQ